MDLLLLHMQKHVRGSQARNDSMELVLEMTELARAEAMGHNRDIIVIGAGAGMKMLVEVHSFDCHQMRSAAADAQKGTPRTLAIAGYSRSMRPTLFTRSFCGTGVQCQAALPQLTWPQLAQLQLLRLRLLWLAQRRPKPP